MRNISRSTVFWFVIVLVVLVLVVVGGQEKAPVTELTFSSFVAQVEEGKIDSVTFQGQTGTGVLVDGSAFTTVGPENREGVYGTLKEYGVSYDIQEIEGESLWVTGLFTLLPLAVIVVLFLLFMRNIQGTNGRAMSFGKSKAKLMSESGNSITFDDVAGIDESKEELQEIVEFLRDPRKVTRLGGRIPKGVLLMGRPGTGKTLLARAVAGEAGVPFFAISGSDFVEMFVGVGASRVRDLFEQGKKQAPCIIFIDEIDAVGRQRGAGLGGGHDEREQTLNQLLVEMDGFEGNEGVIVMAATNRPDVLDPALLRPGRFDRRVVVPAPDILGRKKILEIHTRRVPLADDVDLEILARATPGFSGADLENLANEAALLAARLDKQVVGAEDFEAAREKVYMGPARRSMVQSEREKRVTAYHEAGHAIIAHLLPDHDPVHKVTIIPRGRALGLTWILPDEETRLPSRREMFQTISMTLGGRAAEEVAFDKITGGARSDIERATQMARQMICELGMSEDLGPVAWGESQGEVFLGRQMTRSQSYSEHTAVQIDKEIRTIISRGYDAAKRILTENMHVLHQVAQSLIEKESLDGDEFSELVAEAGPVAPAGMAWMGV